MTQKDTDEIKKQVQTKQHEGSAFSTTFLSLHHRDSPSLFTSLHKVAQEKVLKRQQRG